MINKIPCVLAQDENISISKNVKRKMPKFKYVIGNKINDDKRDFVIIDRKYKKENETKNGKPYTCNKKYYKYKCLRCGNEDWLLESLLCGKQRIGCNTCGKTPKKLIVGINDITVTAPWMVKYFIGGKEEASKYFKFSKVRIDMKCPDCGKIHKNKLIETVCNNHGLTCECQDGWSYPNKFMYAFLTQLNMKFETEKTFDWSDGKRYDDYIILNGKQIIIENQGAFHYINYANFGRGIEKEQDNDAYKRDLALKNGIDFYIMVDCLESDLEYIKSSILTSKLPKLLNFTEKDIDWYKCNDFACSNLQHMVCNFKKSNNNISISNIATKFSISYSTCLNYIQNGSKYGWCEYDRSHEQLLGKSKSLYTPEKPILCVDNGLYFRSAKYVQVYFIGKNMNCKSIRFSCTNGIRHKGLLFNYISREEFNRVKRDSPDKAFGDLFLT